MTNAYARRAATTYNPQTLKRRVDDDWFSDYILSSFIVAASAIQT
jgi:hypothetical protein